MSRHADLERANLETFAATRGGRVYVGVPVSGPELGWHGRSPTHHVDAVWIDTGERGQVLAWDDALRPEFTPLIVDHPAVLISPRGYADRTAFGMLIAGRELFSRAYPQHNLIRAIALSEKMSRRSIAYLSEGIDVLRPGGSAPTPAGNRGPYHRGKPDHPSAEDRLVVRYYDEVLRGSGTLWHEVPVSDAALDALHVEGRAGTMEWWPAADRDYLADVLANFDVDVIEAKRRLNADVIGQTIAGAIVLAHEFPDHRVIRQSVVVAGRYDACLEWVCHKRGIAVTRFDNF